MAIARAGSFASFGSTFDSDLAVGFDSGTTGLTGAANAGVGVGFGAFVATAAGLITSSFLSRPATAAVLGADAAADADAEADAAGRMLPATAGLSRDGICIAISSASGL